MTFVVTLIALLIERFFDWSHIRNWSWFLQLQRYIAQRLQGKHPGLIIAASVLPVAIIVALLAYILHGILYGVIGLIFDLAVLLYCLGPQNLWAEVFGVTAKGNQAAADKVFGVKNIFIAANTRVLAVIFWYLFTGVSGAVIYRTIAILAKSGEPEDTRQFADTIEAILDWLPVRFFTFLFAAGPAFKKVLNCWTKNLPTGMSNNENMLTECGVAAINIDDVKNSANGAMQKAAINLIDRTLIILLVLVAIVILLSY